MNLYLIKAPNIIYHCFHVPLDVVNTAIGCMSKNSIFYDTFVDIMNLPERRCMYRTNTEVIWAISVRPLSNDFDVCQI